MPPRSETRELVDPGAVVESLIAEANKVLTHWCVRELESGGYVDELLNLKRVLVAAELVMRRYAKAHGRGRGLADIMKPILEHARGILEECLEPRSTEVPPHGSRSGSKRQA